MHHLMLMSCIPDYSEADTNPNVAEWQTLPIDILLTESKDHLQMKIIHYTNKTI